MTRRSRIAVVVVVLAIAAWWGIRELGGPGLLAPSDPATPGMPAAHPAAQPGSAAGSQGSRVRPAKTPLSALRPETDVTIAGRVIDIRQQSPVGNVEVVFRGDAGESSTTTHQDGSYAIQLAPGVYRAFVRDDTVLSVGRADRVRLPSPPSADTAGVPDEGLMATVLARGDADGVDLSVVRGGIVQGRVIDQTGRPVAGAVLRARGGGVRPALATDVAESADDGSFELRLPAGTFDLDAIHPRFAGVASAANAQISVRPGDHLTPILTLTAGCVISGRVVGTGGKPASDGAIERRLDNGAHDFLPAGRIDPDGTFRWVTTETVEVSIRAWPWKSPPSIERRFSCRDGARFDDVVFQIPDRRADIEGTLVDQAGEPVGFAYVDLAPLDGDGIAQQERTDALGHWEVYDMPAGRYRVSAQAEARGVASLTIHSPRDGVQLRLGGTGRLEGTTSRLATGSFELALGTCLEGSGQIPVPQARRLVSVTGGQFAVDGLPACQLAFHAIWHGRPISQQVAIPNGGTARVELDLGPPMTKTVHGVVRDASGQLVAGAFVTAGRPGVADITARTDAAGTYTMRTASGANLRASARGRVGFAHVGGANVDDEQVDVVLEDAPEPDP